MMLFYIIPFEKRFCSYLKPLADWRLWGCGRARAHGRANKHARRSPGVCRPFSLSSLSC